MRARVTKDQKEMAQAAGIPPDVRLVIGGAASGTDAVRQAVAVATHVLMGLHMANRDGAEAPA